MAHDPYDFCECGSGKKFKWCCQPIFVHVEKAYQRHAEGQREASLQLMDKIIASHSDNPEVFGRKAHLLILDDRLDEAKECLQKAFAINPNYPFGFQCEALIRLAENDIDEAVRLLWKAAEAFHPSSRALMDVYLTIFNLQKKQSHEFSAKTALALAARHDPSKDLLQDYENLYGRNGNAAAIVRTDYRYLDPPAGASEECRKAWSALQEENPAHPVKAARFFEEAAKQFPDEPAVWYNLGLAQAQSGAHQPAIEAFERYVELETDEEKAAAAWAVVEALRLEGNQYEQSDYCGYVALFQVMDAEDFVKTLTSLIQERRVFVLSRNLEEGLLGFWVVEKTPELVGGGDTRPMARVQASALLVKAILRICCATQSDLESLSADLEARFGDAISQLAANPEPLDSSEIFLPALKVSFDVQKSEWRDRLIENIRKYYEEVWIHKPLKSLNSVAPIDAAASPVLRKKLLGNVRYLESVCKHTFFREVDFNRVCRKLGLLEGADGEHEGNIDAMGAAELAALETDKLSDDDLERAFRSAMKLDARELAGKFAKAIVARPVPKDKSDRYYCYSHLVQLALEENDTETALHYLDDAERVDSEHNEGRRRDDFELRRGRIYAQRGEFDQAQQIFERLLERTPDPKHHGLAAEVMLSARQKERALRFAEKGLAAARSKNDRDMEQYLLELVEAARKG
ncbi:MAG: protein disulfide-isomerase [Gemmatales bacterium]|nr:MAG: protein disulfide-isomerase [Gemmatales bacterium]